MRTTKHLGVAVVFAVMAGACGGGGGADDTGDDAGDDTGGPDAGDDTGPDGSTAPDPQLYPLAVGRTWTYAVTSTYASCPGGAARTLAVTGESTTDGRATYDVTGFCGFAGHTSVDGDVVEEYYDWGPTGWMRALDEPVSAGHAWTTTNGSATFDMTYASEGTVDGHPDCWRVTQEVSYTTYWIYCRGVGLVRYELVDLAGGTIRAELVDTSF
jgi:hypothetical protein